MDYAIELVSLQPQRAAVVRAQVAHDGIGPFLGGAFGQVMAVAGGQQATPSGPPFARYEIAGRDFRIEAGFPMSKVITDSGDVHAIELPGGPAVTTVHVGAYEDVAGAYKAIEQWFADNGFAPAGAPWESYLDGPEVPQPRTLVTWPCRRAG